MQLLVYRAEGNLGPFSPEELQQQVEAGIVRPDDLAWHDGLTQWQPVSTFLPGAVPAAIPAPGIGTVAPASAEATRLAYLSHEQNIRSIGTYYYFSGGMMVLLTLLLFLSGLISYFASKDNPPSILVAGGVEAVILGGLGAFALWTSAKFRRLERSALIPGTLLAALGLLGFPVGTLLNGFILYFMYCERGRFVFSDQYHGVVAATPQIVWKNALWVKIIIGLTILAFVSIVVISILIALGNQVSRVSSRVQ